MSANRADEQTPLITDSSAIAKDPAPAIMSSETFWKIGAIYGATAVAFGAFGAHGLKKHIADPARIANWSTAAHYQVCSSHLPVIQPSLQSRPSTAAIDLKAA